MIEPDILDLLRRILTFLYMVRGWDSAFVPHEWANRLIEEIEEVLNRE